MARLNVVDPATATGKVKELFDGPLKTRQSNILKGIANSPATLEAYFRFSGGLKKGELTPLEREVIALALGELNNCEYCLAAHTAGSRNAGIPDDQILAARRRSLDDPKLNALARFVTALHEKRGFADGEELTALRNAGYNDGQVVEIIAGYALNLFTNYFNHVNETDVDFPLPPKLS